MNDSVARMSNVSIHAPAWGATHKPCGDKYGYLSFNPRSRVGSDADGIVNNIKAKDVSIHAPAWGATRSSD